MTQPMYVDRLASMPWQHLLKALACLWPRSVNLLAFPGLTPRQIDLLAAAREARAHEAALFEPSVPPVPRRPVPVHVPAVPDVVMSRPQSHLIGPGITCKLICCQYFFLAEVVAFLGSSGIPTVLSGRCDTCASSGIIGPLQVCGVGSKTTLRSVDIPHSHTNRSLREGAERNAKFYASELQGAK